MRNPDGALCLVGQLLLGGIFILLPASGPSAQPHQQHVVDRHEQNGDESRGQHAADDGGPQRLAAGGGDLLGDGALLLHVERQLGHGRGDAVLGQDLGHVQVVAPTLKVKTNL